MQCVTGPLTSTQLVEEVSEIVRLLQSNGIDRVVVEYGWGCKPLAAGQLWQDIEIEVPELVAFIEQAIRTGVFSPGEADLMVQDRSHSFECLLCRESDIHLVTEDEAILAQATRRWMEMGFGGFKLAAAEDFEPI